MAIPNPRESGRNSAPPAAGVDVREGGRCPAREIVRDTGRTSADTVRDSGRAADSERAAALRGLEEEGFFRVSTGASPKRSAKEAFVSAKEAFVSANVAIPFPFRGLQTSACAVCARTMAPERELPRRGPVTLPGKP